LQEDEEYELLPRHEIDHLKKELERLKKNPLGESKEGEVLLDAVNNLNSNIKKLIDIFAKADADLAKEYSENNPAESLNIIKAQNEHIAHGVLALADVIREMKEVSLPQQKNNNSASQNMNSQNTPFNFNNQNQGFNNNSNDSTQGLNPNNQGFNNNPMMPEFPPQMPNTPPPPFELSIPPNNQMPPPPFPQEKRGFFRR
jgi:hypothetical protein